MERSCAHRFIVQGDNLLVIGGQDGTVIIFDALEAKVKTFLKKVGIDVVLSTVEKLVYDLSRVL